jgi:hypothetical protein
MRRALLLLAVAALTGAPAGTAAAADVPKAEGAVLTAADFDHGAAILSQTATPFPYLPHLAYSSAYTRTFTSVTIGDLRLASITSSAIVVKDQLKLEQFMEALIAALHDKAQRRVLLETAKDSFAASSRQTVTGIGFIRDRTLQTGDSAAEVDVFIRTKRVTVAVSELYVQRGPALDFVLFASGAPGLTAGEVSSIAKTLNAHIAAASSPPPANTVPPTITGSLQPGQILTASPGTWTGAHITYAYQWFRCDGTGTGCVAIPAATVSTYTVSAADAGHAFAVSVTATSPAGSTIKMSKPTAAVPPS